MNAPTPLIGLDRAALEEVARGHGQPAYRGRQLAEWLYLHGAADFAAMTSLPTAWRAQLANEYTVGRASIVRRHVAADETTKLLLELADGQRVETVALPWPERLSVCVSSQTGCAVGCRFCATGYLGAGRNLTTGEMTDQLLSAGQDMARRPTHAVFMGMGEPLTNLDAVLAAIRLWRDELDLSPRRVTVSTVGIPPGIMRLAEADLPLTLAVSLHAAADELRAALIPTVARRWAVAEVLGAARAYATQTGRRLTYEVVLLGGINDRPGDAQTMAERLRPGEHVNLIPFNAVGEAPYRPPSRDHVAGFRATLEAAGLVVTQRQTRGDSIAGACGQLRAATDGE